MFSRFTKWLNFDRLKLGTADQWNEWETEYQKQAPIRYWLTHKLPHLTWYPIKWKYDKVRDWVRYRIRPYHIIDTGLPPRYYDTDTLLLHANFNLLKDFVEKEKAHMYFWTTAEARQETRLGRLVRRKKPSPMDGIKYLEWETTLDAPEDPSDANPTQAATARETLELYTWWVFDRPNRAELTAPEAPEDDDSGRSIMYRMSDVYRKKHPEYYAAFQKWCTDHSKQEQDWDDEDTEMLIRLIKIRKSLWT